MIVNDSSELQDGGSLEHESCRDGESKINENISNNSNGEKQRARRVNLM